MSWTFYNLLYCNYCKSDLARFSNSSKPCEFALRHGISLPCRLRRLASLSTSVSSACEASLPPVVSGWPRLWPFCTASLKFQGRFEELLHCFYLLVTSYFRETFGSTVAAIVPWRRRSAGNSAREFASSAATLSSIDRWFRAVARSAGRYDFISISRDNR